MKKLFLIPLLFCASSYVRAQQNDYTFQAVDNSTSNIILPANTFFTNVFKNGLLNGVMTIDATFRRNSLLRRTGAMARCRLGFREK